jgi:hypothetical protein
MVLPQTHDEHVARHRRKPASPLHCGAARVARTSHAGGSCSAGRPRSSRGHEAQHKRVRAQRHRVDWLGALAKVCTILSLALALALALYGLW